MKSIKKDKIRIASGQGFWGDLPNAPIDQVRNGPIDYLVMDYLAEVTMSIMQKQRLRNPEYGYARDFVDVVTALLPEVAEKKIKIISNAGGVNPVACKDAILASAKKAGCLDIRVAVVHGDNILPEMDDYIAKGHHLSNMETNEPVINVRDQLLSANVYFGAKPIVEALQMNADIIITGRVTDTGLTLAPMIYEFDWDMDDPDLMAAGTVAGHLIECGGQVSGGNFTDWETVPDMEHLGFPIVEAFPDGTFVLTKHPGTGGLVSEMTVKEQLLYEIGDPKTYITPDGIADFTSIQVRQQEQDRVHVFGIKGRPATPTYKVSASFIDGYKLVSSLVYCWPEAIEKARAAAQILQKRASSLNLKIDEFRAELVGLNACDEQPDSVSKGADEPTEVQLRIAAKSSSKEDLNRLGKEIAPLILTGPSGVTGFAGGRPKASEIVAYWPALLDKTAVTPVVELYSIG